THAELWLKPRAWHTVTGQRRKGHPQSNPKQPENSSFFPGTHFFTPQTRCKIRKNQQYAFQQEEL
ncbi:MAG: hypothetical protein FWC28_00145, partial [Proteobacteria bacterium]|nr:hypothetical protein [Pseudomonadota bacterium]